MLSTLFFLFMGIMPRFPCLCCAPVPSREKWPQTTVDDLLMILGTNFQDPFQISWQFFLRHSNRVNTLLNVVTRSRLVLFHCFIPSCPPFGLKLRTKVLSHCTWLSLRQFPAKPFLALFRSRCAFRRTQANSFSCTRSEVDFHQERS